MKRTINPLRDILICFAKICEDKGEIPYFLCDMQGASNFWGQENEKNPSEFREVEFRRGICTDYSLELRNWADSELMTSDEHSNIHQIDISAAQEYEKIQAGKKAGFLAAGFRFYEQFACDENGDKTKRTKIK